MHTGLPVSVRRNRSAGCLAIRSLGFVERLNNRIRVIQRRAYGLRDEECLRLMSLTCMLPTL